MGSDTHQGRVGENPIAGVHGALVRGLTGRGAASASGRTVLRKAPPPPRFTLPLPPGELVGMAWHTKPCG